MKLARMLRLYKAALLLNSESIAKEIGLSKATYSRLESGKDLSSENLIKVLNWLFKKEG